MRELSLKEVLQVADWNTLHVTCGGKIRKKNWLETCFSCCSRGYFSTRLACALARRISARNKVAEDCSLQGWVWKRKMAAARLALAQSYMRRQLRQKYLPETVINEAIARHFSLPLPLQFEKGSHALREKCFPALWRARTVQAARKAIDVEIERILPELQENTRKVLGVPDSAGSTAPAEEL